MTRRSRHVLAGLLGLAVVAGTAVPVLAQSHTQQQRAVVSHVKRIQANNFRFCSNKASSCSTTADTNHKTHVLVDTRVKWIYKDTACDANALCPGHNVNFAHRGTMNDTRTQGAVIYTTVFHHTGKFSYFCSHHKSEGMTGRIVVTRH